MSPDGRLQAGRAHLLVRHFKPRSSIPGNSSDFKILPLKTFSDTLSQ
jgi:hypothetical protein